jgi:acetylglutamate synthase
MKLSEVKQILENADSLHFELQNGKIVPHHFHVTEVGMVTKKFIDCGGTVRNENVANFQLWNANDTDHRLKPQKLLNIIALSERFLGIEDLEIEVEYQAETIVKYDLEFNGKNFVLINKQTACLALDACGIPPTKIKVSLADLQNVPVCTPGGGCC